MKLNVVPARTGLHWVRLGIQVFLRQPLALVGLFVLYWFAIVCLALVPVLGIVASLVLVPAGTLGFMVATGDAVDGRFPMPARLLAGFRQGRPRSRALLQLGFMHATLVLLTMLGTYALFPPPDGAGTDDPLQMLSAARLLATAVQLPVSVLFCYAPALSHWHGIPATKALFFSVVALWRNLGAFTVFGLGWAAVTMVVASVLALAYALAGTGMLIVLAVPAVLALSAMMLASTYFTFRDSFSADPPGDAGALLNPAAAP
ncbi:MAG: BPSS1780 family membrane protein [Ramlibacter sp.]